MTTATAPVSAPPVVLLTAEEFCDRYADAHAELVKGVVQETPMPTQRHGQICRFITRELDRYLTTNDIGHVTINDSFVQTGTNTVRGGDVCFFNYERLPRGPIPEGLLSVVPDLVVEVRSPSDTWSEIFAKISEYLRAGVRAVVVLDPKSETASVYRAEELQQIFHNGDPLVVSEILPGFSVELARLFA